MGAVACSPLTLHPLCRLGRKGPLIWSYLQLAVSGAATAYFSSFGAYCAFRFLMGMTFSGIILNSLSLGESRRGSLREGAPATAGQPMWWGRGSHAIPQIGDCRFPEPHDQQREILSAYVVSKSPWAGSGSLRGHKVLGEERGQPRDLTYKA